MQIAGTAAAGHARCTTCLQLLVVVLAAHSREGSDAGEEAVGERGPLAAWAGRHCTTARAAAVLQTRSCRLRLHSQNCPQLRHPPVGVAVCHSIGPVRHRPDVGEELNSSEYREVWNDVGQSGTIQTEAHRPLYSSLAAPHPSRGGAPSWPKPWRCTGICMAANRMATTLCVGTMCLCKLTMRWKGSIDSTPPVMPCKRGGQRWVCRRRPTPGRHAPPSKQAGRQLHEPMAMLGAALCSWTRRAQAVCVRTPALDSQSMAPPTPLQPHARCSQCRSLRQEGHSRKLQRCVNKAGQ